MPEKVTFPFGTHVYREPRAPIEETLADLKTVARLGFTMVKLQESWAIDEPAEGEIHLETIERLIARAGELGLGVYLGLTMEQAPAWLWRKYPDASMVYEDGTPDHDPTQYLLPADGKPGPCWDHPAARDAAQRFIGALARQLGRYDNIACWNTWQEIGFWPLRAGHLGLCYCAHTLARYREWLRSRYGSLAALNATWRTAYGDWEHIQPPRKAPAVPSWIDWRDFMDNVYLSRALAFRVQALRENDPGHRPVFAHVAKPVIGGGAEWRYAAQHDFFAHSVYPAGRAFNAWDDDVPRAGAPASREATLNYEMCTSVALEGDYTRSATGRDKEMWAAEFQGGPYTRLLHKGRVPSPADIRRWVLTEISVGASGISFWNHRAEIFWSECNGYGLLDSRGDTTPRAEEAGRLARALNRHASLIRNSRLPRAEVAILVRDDLWHFAQATPPAADHLAYDIRGLYRMCWSAGVQVDFVEVSQLATGGLDGYALAILPFPLALSDEVVSRLAAYVDQGGVLLGEACPGRYDRYGMCPRGEMAAGAEPLFGAQHRFVATCREPGTDARWTPAERGWGEFLPPTRLTGTGVFAGTTVTANLYVQTFSPTTASPILMRHGEVAGVINAHGAGQAILVGTYLGHSATAHVDGNNEGFLARAFALAGVRPDCSGAILRRRRVNGPDEVWLLTNPEAERAEAEVDTAGFSEVVDLLNEPLVRQGNVITVAVDPFDVRCLILRR
ncbi:MAG: beta-galactosidase [Chloroflexi bacterium]|nr:beta-galactosidase [Chloroflexota bacterium]